MVIRANDYGWLVSMVEDEIENMMKEVTRWYLFQKDVVLDKEGEWQEYDLALVISPIWQRPNERFFEEYDYMASMVVDLRLREEVDVEWIIERLRDDLLETK